MNRKKIDLLKKAASQNIHRVLDSLRIHYNERYQYVTGACPIHNGDNENAWSYHLDKDFWTCFSRDCQKKFGNDIFGLVQGILDCRFPEACNYVEKILNKEDIDLNELSHISVNKQFVKQRKKKMIFPEESISKLLYHPYLEGRGYPRRLIESYQIGVTSEGYKQMSNRLIIPIRDIDCNIIGFTGRTLFPNWKDKKIPKWMHSKGFNGAENLFNIDRAKKYIEESSTAIIVEGPLDVLRLEQAGVHNSVAIFGRKLHNGQIALLVKCGTQNLVISLDGDVAGKSGADSAFRTAKAFFNVKIVELENKDVGDLTVNKVQEIFV